MKEKLNVILITIDSLRADHLGFMGYQKNISPNIDKFSKESIVFKQAFATGPITSHSFPAILTSTYPFDYQGPLKIEKPRVLISEFLKENGFLTAAFHSNAYLSEYFGYKKGWDYFEEMIPPRDLGLARGKQNIQDRFFKRTLKLLGKMFIFIFPGLVFRARYLLYKLGVYSSVKKEPNARFLNQTAKDFLSAAKEKPFFCWIHYMDVHGPYLPYDNYFKERKLSYSELVGKELPIFLSKSQHFFGKILERFSKKYIKYSIDLYDQGIKYLDEQLGDLMDFLKKEEIEENTIIFITADHGDEFLEHGGGAHYNQLYNEILRVPLLIKTPGQLPKTVDKKVSLIDLPSTISDLLNLKTSGSFKGKNLFQPENEFIFHQTSAYHKRGLGVPLPEIKEISGCKMACQSKEWKYIIDYSSQKEEVYDLIKDPGEKNNIVLNQPEVLFRLRNIIKEFKEKNPPLSLVAK